MKGKWNYKFKSMQATIVTMFVNEKIIRIYSFVHSYYETARQMLLKRSIVAKTSHNPWTPQIPHRGGGIVVFVASLKIK